VTAARSRSVVWRLAFAFAAVSLVSFAAVAAYVYAAILDDYAQRDADDLRNKAAFIRHVIEDSAAAGNVHAAAVRLRDVVRSHHGLAVVVQDAAGRQLLAVPEGDVPPIVFRNEAGEEDRVETHFIRDAAGERAYRAVRGRLPASAADIRYVLLLDLAGEAVTIRSHLISILAATAIGLAVSVALGLLAVRANLKPLHAITAAARTVSASNLAVDLPTAGMPRELRELGEAFNEMLASLRGSFARLSEFSADLAHELRTPVGNLIGIAQVTLAKPRTADEYRLVLESSLEECERLSRMVSDMLLLVRMDRPTEPLRRAAFDLAAEARHVVQYFEPLLEDRGLSVNVSGAGAVNADRDLVRRAIGNLVSNAVRHSPDGGRIEIGVRARDGRTELVVRNPGPGILTEHLPRIFDRFHRVDPSRAGAGTGLGLAIVKSIAEAHGGRVSAASEPGRQTEFVLELPAGIAAEERAPSAGE
jgi:two-component system heavy metal sensor histidine kinase CusS